MPREILRPQVLSGAFVALATMPKTLLNLKEFIAKHQPKGAVIPSDLKVGDVVACMDDEQKLVRVGTVQYVSPQGDYTLPRGHPDGLVGEVFVLDSSKGRANTKKPFKGPFFCVTFLFCYFS